LAATASLAVAQPQDEGPVVIGEKRPALRGFELVRLDAALDLLADWRMDRLKQQGLPTITEREALYRQTLDLSGEFTLGHKNFVDVSGNLSIGFEEDSVDSDQAGASSSYISLTSLYDLRALILGNSFVPTTAYARRDENRINQDFGPSVKTTTTEFGAIAQVRSQVLPTQVQVFHKEQDQEAQLGRGGFGYTQDGAILHSDASLATNQRLTLDYTFDHIKQTGTFTDEYNQHQANLIHWLTFGPRSAHSLRSSLWFEDRSGAFAERIFRWDEDLTLQHTPRLETRYNLSLEDLERNSQEQQLARGSALIRHKLFDSLTSTASVGGSHVESPGLFTTDEVFFNGGLDYTKKVPHGRLDAGAHLGFTQQHNGPRGSNVPISNNVFVFNDPFPVTISRRNIIPSSIVVRDTARIRVFIENVDYSVAPFPDRVELRRIVGGAIANGQAVSVDYEVGPEPANTIDATTGALSLRYDIEEGFLAGLGVYGLYRQLDQAVDAADPSLFVLDNFKDLRYGLQYRRAGFTLTAERQNHDSTVSPFDGTRFEALYDRRFSRVSLLTLSASREEVNYHNTGSDLVLYLAAARFTQRFGEGLDVSLHTQGRFEQHNDSPDIRGYEAGLDISWHKNQTTIYGTVFGSFLDSGPSSTLSETISIGLKRAF
jgi:hypothetical protein